MYLTRMPLNTALQTTKRALAAPNLFHGAVEAAFPGERKRNLWRVDHLAGESYLLVLSEDKPDLTMAAKQFGNAEDSVAWETKDYMPLLERIKEGDVWQFRLVANPVRSCMGEQEASGERQERGSVRAHTSLKYQKEWLIKRSEKHGFSLEEDSFSVVHSQWYVFYKGKNRREKVSLFAATYEGYLKVQDKELFRQTLLCGLGRGKAYGLGMLTIANQKGVNRD
ncbi:MAG: type I-E CRISPR-associated protein Cas6/Cse3/CasE [Lachnospiraceae bacterium]